MTPHPDEEFVRQAMLVCTILCGFSVQAAVRLVGSPPLAGKCYTHVIALFTTGALVLLYAISAGMIFLSTDKASFDELSELAVDVAYGLVIGLILFLLGLITLVDLHSRRLAIGVSLLSTVLLLLFGRLLIIGFW
jgi:hypothetical protein